MGSKGNLGVTWSNVFYTIVFLVGIEYFSLHLFPLEVSLMALEKSVIEITLFVSVSLIMLCSITDVMLNQNWGLKIMLFGLWSVLSVYFALVFSLTILSLLGWLPYLT